MTACEALERSEMDLKEFSDSLEENSTNSYLVKLERRLRSLEQPVWEISRVNERWIDCGKGPCKCRPETKSVICWQNELSTIPPDQLLPHDVITIDLGINRLTTLHKNAFRSLSQLVELDLFDNKLDHLPDNIFAHLESLKYLNRMRVIPETLLDKLELLEDLDLSNNLLEIIPKFAFMDLVSLRRLFLVENNITILPTGVFDKLVNLEQLNLRKNQISHLSPYLFDKLQSLKILHLTNNKISQISSNDFKKLTNIIELHLGQNFISDLPENAFVENRNLDKLFLFSNNLEEVKEKTFNGLVGLTLLLINNNILKDIHPRTFHSFLAYAELHLDSNKFHFLPAKFLDYLTELVSIKLAKNPWHCDCNILYLAIWIDLNADKLWDSQPTCRGPGDLGGSLLKDMQFDNLCEGQWASMLNLSPRIPIKNKLNEELEWWRNSTKDKEV
ncbi:hypothetical protein JTB14_012519 [Gonioctena quinquepunctata]|nr:hypothetical protein JTB14_012519 [Gonioctena quinquepunctata]